MKILLLPCHSILEYDEYKLFTEMGHDVFSLGSYINPATPHDKKRPALEGKYHGHLVSLTDVYTKDNLHKEMIDWADVIMVHHIPRWIFQNWDKMRHKKVIWRSIGQSMSDTENQLAHARHDGLKIVRYSPTEEKIPGFIGSDAMIRFYKDPEEFKGWDSKEKEVITFGQAMKGRGVFCNFNLFDYATVGSPRKVYGPDNDDMGELSGGALSYEEMKQKLREASCYFYTGTQPAPYTLNFIEAWMTGIPIVAIGPEHANTVFKIPTYEVNELIKNGESGYVFDNLEELKFYTKELISNKELGKKISDKGREAAIEYFGKDKIKKEWETFFNNL